LWSSYEQAHLLRAGVPHRGRYGDCCGLGYRWRACLGERAVKTVLPVQDIVDVLSREEQVQKHVGGFGVATGLRHAVTLIIRMADADEESIEPPSEDD
jgi:hypothetical protein